MAKDASLFLTLYQAKKKKGIFFLLMIMLSLSHLFRNHVPKLTAFYQTDGRASHRAVGWMGADGHTAFTQALLIGSSHEEFRSSPIEANSTNANSPYCVNRKT
jgi:hypothetical protein